MLRTLLYVIYSLKILILAVALLSEDLKNRVASSSLQEECLFMCPNKSISQDIPTSENKDYYMIQNLESDQYQYHSDNLIVRNKVDESLLTNISTIPKPSESVTSKPTFPRAFVHFKQISEDISITFRWNRPEFINEMIEKYTVQYWYIENFKAFQVSDNIPATNLEYSVHNLKKGPTYYFQVRAHTKIDVGPYTDLINVSTTHENPIPQLLITSSNGMIKSDMDLFNFQMINEEYDNIKEIVYSVFEARVYWIDKMQNLILKLGNNDIKKITKLDITAHNLCIDWVARNLYWIQNSNLMTSSIMKLDITMWEIGQVKYDYILNITKAKFLNVLPSMGLFYWMESISNDQYMVMQSDLDGKNVQPFLRNENDTCFCQYKLLELSSMQVDNTNIENPLMYWTWKNHLIVADIYGCRCNMILSAENNKIFFEYLAIDMTNIYMYNIKEQVIYMLKKKYVFLENKENAFKHIQIIHIKVNDLFINNIYRVIAADSSLQPYPSNMCMIPNIEGNTKNNLESFIMTQNNIITEITTNSIVLKLPKPVPKYECKKYNLPTTIYSISLNWESTQYTYFIPYERYHIIQNLTSCTKYTLTLRLQNFYVFMLSHSSIFDMKTFLRTNPDKLKEPENVTVQVLTPTLLAVYWMPPKENCTPVSYEVHWKLVSSSNDAQQIDRQLHQYNYTIINKPERTENGKFFTKIQPLLSGEKYLIYVRVYPVNFSNAYSDSLNKTFYMYSEPNNLTLSGVSINSMTISWIPNVNLTIHYVLEYKNATMQEWQIADNIEMNNNEIMYYIENLLSRTLYKFRLILKYPEYKEDFIWPSDKRFTFTTLDDNLTAPGRPTITKLQSLMYQLNWEPAQSHYSQVTLYRLEGLIIENNYKDGHQIDKNKHWNLYYNGRNNYWIITRNITRYITRNMNQKYLFRVQAKNSYGFSAWSELSAAIDLTESAKILTTINEYYLPLMIILIAIVIVICVCCFYYLYRQYKEGNEVISSIIPDIELATLYEIPRGNVQFNTLYISMLQYNPDKFALTTIKTQQITLIKFIGSGAFGKVYQGIVKNLEGLDTTPVAIKRLRNNASEQERKKFLDEAKIMSQFRHKHVLRLLGICLDGDSPLLILELMEADLLEYLKEIRTLQPSEPHALRLLDLLAMCEDVARGCCYLEQLHFVHRDLACRNCLISTRDRKNRVVKIGDFGLTRDIYTNDYYRMKGKGPLPVRWMAPESIIDGIFSSQSDVWAFGVLMWEITSLGEQPYSARTNLEAWQYVRAGGRLPKPSNCPLMLYQLMMRCWSSADNRPTFKVCVENIGVLKSDTEDMELNPINIIWPTMKALESPTISEKIVSSDFSTNSQTGIITYQI
ncbi:proto-oncogene tyrosine-protein kinase ROS-like isoform X2 [Anoplolepis gracilipes]|uniref:proto-oncogene tyrosine-protein kinase ROS-like isoform X2 n=1 Tax=Anoplolepis gracilipes TaxID=354296 RepID=UPI003B9ECD6F